MTNWGRAPLKQVSRPNRSARWPAPSSCCATRSARTNRRRASSSGDRSILLARCWERMAPRPAENAARSRDAALFQLDFDEGIFRIVCVDDVVLNARFAEVGHARFHLAERFAGSGKKLQPSVHK